MNRAAEQRLRTIFGKTHGHCHFCGDKLMFGRRGFRGEYQKGAWEVDHVIQRGKGGSKTAENCLPACTRCNRLRWHRSRDQLHQVMEYGLIAAREVRSGTELGQVLKQKLAKQKGQNRRRRARRARG